MKINELLLFVTEIFERLGIRYFVTGSNAAILYGEIRLTNDVDVVADMGLHDIDLFLAQFPPDEFYVSKSAVVDAVSRHSMFNIIHLSTSLKVDVVISPPSAYLRSQFLRAKRVEIRENQWATVCSPEDVILSKLRFFKLGESDKHLRDIAGILRISGDGIDYPYIEEWAARLDLSEIWVRVITKVEGST